MTEQLRVQSIDELCAYLAAFLDAGHSASPQLSGRTLAICSAYKPFGVNEWRKDLLTIAVRKHRAAGGGIGLFIAQALPFGAIGSVTSCLWASNASSFIATRAPDLYLTAFFDDFTVINPVPEEANSTFYWNRSFGCWGVSFAESGDKAPPFSEVFKTLGLIVDLSKLSEGQTLDKEDLVPLLTTLQDKVAASRLVVVSRELSETWFIFTDGAHEPTASDQVTIGAVLVDPGGVTTEHFGSPVDRAFLQKCFEGSSHPIYELEFLPIHWRPMRGANTYITVRSYCIATTKLLVVDTFVEWEIRLLLKLSSRIL